MTLQSEDMGKLVAGPDGWIEWTGGVNPVGVTPVEVKYRNGETEIRDAIRFGWTHWHEAERPNLGGYDIIAFRPAHREAQPETDGGGDWKERAERAEARIAEIAMLFGVPDGGRYLNDWKAKAAKTIPTPEGQTEGAVVSEAVSILEKLSEWLTRVQLESDDTDAEKALLALNCDSVASVSRRLAALASKGV